MEELWKDIKDFEGFYQVSNLGQIRSCINRFKNTRKVFIMSLETTNRGYKRVYLSKPIRKRLSVHRIVAETFIPNSDNKPCINHKDNNPSNNCVSNLEWCTYSENLLYAQKQGRLYEAQSRGGIVASTKAQHIATEKAKALVGKQVNSWLVLSYIGKKSVSPNGVKREKLLCQCKCGFQQEIESVRLYNGKATMCRRCAKNLHKDKDIV